MRHTRFCLLALAVLSPLAHADRPLKLQAKEVACFTAAPKNSPFMRVDLRVKEESPGIRWAMFEVKFRGEPRLYGANLECMEEQGIYYCGVPCDGGSFSLWKNDDGEYLLVSDAERGVRLKSCGKPGPAREFQQKAPSFLMLKRLPEAECREALKRPGPP